MADNKPDEQLTVESPRCVWQSFEDVFKFWRTGCGKVFERLQETCPACGERVWLTGFDAWWEARKSYHP